MYLDTSAMVKLVVAEKETPDLVAYLREHADDGLFTAELTRTELIRAVMPLGPQAIAAARKLLRGTDSVVLSRQLLDDAGTLGPHTLRSLDAIHLAAARKAGDMLRAVITYDTRMMAAAHALGLAVQAPGRHE